jgi:hypothetical protein
MNLLPQGFNLDGPTWFYLSLLLIVAVFFRFHRVWSLRNVDLGLLLVISPGLILIDGGRSPAAGEYLLVTISAVLLVRLLLDSLLTRRPHTTQNLNPAGLMFLCASTFLVLSLYALEEAGESTANSGSIQQADAMLNRTTMPVEQAATQRNDLETADDEVGPTAAVFVASLQVAVGHVAPQVQKKLPEIMAMVAHLAVIAGLLLVGRNLFGDLQLGTAMATLYMLIPCTAIDVGAFIHVFPSALIVWAIVAYQRPAVAGALLGMACGTLVFPVFLVPVWVAFYGRRSGIRFVVSLLVATVALLSTYALTSPDPVVFWKQAVTTIKLPLHALLGEDIAVSSLTEISALHRIPIVAAYFVILGALTLWPRKKTIEHLIASSAALVVGTQFWYPQQTGAYLMWAVPLLLIVVFRPRIAQLSQNRRRALAADVRTAPPPPPPPPPLATPSSTRVRSGTALQRATLFR